MSILSSTYNLCKQIKSLQLRTDIKALIHNLNTSSTKELDRSTFGYLARQYNLEILGYLVTHIQSDQIKKVMPIVNFKPLTDSEILLLERAHSLILQIDRKCTNQLLKIFPESEKALDNYFKYPYSFKSKPEDETNELDDNINELVNEFELHPSFLFIKNKIHQYPKIMNIPGNILQMTMIEMGKDLLKSDPKFISHVMSQILELSRHNDEQADLIRITLSLFCIRLSLKNLNKLIYMSFFKDRLTVLNNDSVFNIKSHHTNILGEFLVLENQPRGEGYSLLPTEIILVKLKSVNDEIDSLYFINSFSTSFVSEYGSIQEFRLRIVDQHLNIINTLYYR